MSNKYLTENGWKDAVKKHKVVVATDLQRALATYENLADDKLDERLKALAGISYQKGRLKTNLDNSLKTAKAQKAKPEVIKNLEEVIKYLAEIDKAVEAEQKQIKEAKEKLAKDTEAAQPPMPTRLVTAAMSISGAQGSRIKKVAIIVAKHPSSWKTLWYYDESTVWEYVKKPELRKALSQKGGGRLPFTGDAWVVFPFKRTLDQHCPRGCPDKNLVTFLTSLDNSIVSSLKPLHDRQGVGEGGSIGVSVNEFMKHVGNLAKNGNHLYSAY